MLLALASAGFAEERQDAASLLREVAESARNTTNWRIQGTIEESGSEKHSPPAVFILLMRSPGEIRFEQQGGRMPVTTVCDGVNSWVYSPLVHKFRRLALSTDAECAPIALDWKSLPATFHSPVLAGSRTVEAERRAIDCQLVRGFSDPELPSGGRLKRTLCIDTSRKLIVWEKTENKHGSRVYSYDRIDRNTELPAEAFVFEAPPGSQQASYEMPRMRRLGSRSVLSKLGISTPRLLSKVEPSYDEASRQDRIEGTVVLYVVIDTSGVPGDILVIRPLNAGLTAQAIEAVRRWRFVPGKKDGQPVAVPATIEVNFRLH